MFMGIHARTVEVSLILHIVYFFDVKMDIINPITLPAQKYLILPRPLRIPATKVASKGGNLFSSSAPAFLFLLLLLSSSSLCAASLVDIPVQLNPRRNSRWVFFKKMKCYFLLLKSQFKNKGLLEFLLLKLLHRQILPSTLFILIPFYLRFQFPSSINSSLSNLFVR